MILPCVAVWAGDLLRVFLTVPNIQMFCGRSLFQAEEGWSQEEGEAADVGGENLHEHLRSGGRIWRNKCCIDWVTPIWMIKPDESHHVIGVVAKALFTGL